MSSVSHSPWLRKTEAQTVSDHRSASLAWPLNGVLPNLHIKGTLLDKEPSANAPKT